MKKQLLLFGMILCGLNFYAQNRSSIVGKISDGNGYLPGVNVVVLEGKNGVTTDLDGSFQLTNLVGEKIKVAISYLGYKEITKEVNLAPGVNNLGTITMDEEEGVLSEVIIKGFTAPSQIKALSIKKKSFAIMDVLAADAVGKLPDRNAAEAVQRMPGVSVNRYHGEANQVSVRGTPFGWNSTLYNGNRLPSASVFGSRNTLLDAIPTEMIQYIQLSKAITPDIEGDAIGGSVDFISRIAQSKDMLNVSLGGGYNQRANKSTYNGSVVFGKKFFDKKLGVVLAASIWDRNFSTDEMVVDYNINAANQDQRYAINSVNAKRYFGSRKTKAFSGTIDFELNESNKFFGKFLIDKFEDVRPVYESFYDFAKKRYVYSYRYSFYETALNSFEVGGNHLIGSKVKVDWSVSSNDMDYILNTPPNMPKNQRGLPIAQFTQNLSGDFGNRATDGLVYNLFDSPDANGVDLFNIDPKLTNPNDFLDPTRLQLTQLVIYQTNQKDKDKIAQFNLTYNPTAALSLKMGAKGKLKKYEGQLTPLAFLPGAALGIPGSPALRTLSEFKTEAYPNESTSFKEIGGTFAPLIVDPITKGELFRIFTPDYLADNGFADYSSKSNPTTKYVAHENVFSNYLMATYKLTDKTTLIGGVRNEYTMINIKSAKYDVETKTVTTVEENNSYNAFLPMLHIKYAANDNMNIRAAYTRTFSRANFGDLNPGENVDTTNPGLVKITKGNADLLPTFANNFDLMGEYFLDDIGLITAGVFYKDLSNYIFKDLSVQKIDNVDYLITQPKNVENASLYGFEMGITKRFTEWDNFFGGFGIDLNGAFIKSSLKVNRFDADGGLVAVDKTTLPNQSKFLFNSSIFYEKYGFMFKIAGNYRGKSVETINQNLGPDYYISARSNFTVDFSADYSISDKLKVFMEVRNLANTPFQQYLGTNENRFTSSEWSAINGQLGVKYQIF
ncbi:TonB-dependent receptor [Flavobacterium sp. ARAG 55.4]|uniref:TonB-dependent receptor n=1 Tax=Flavobacterium sp. ARAG 55.4 TaxID=3451357 RepID=UPI003F458F32